MIEAAPGVDVLEVVEPGLLTTVQDLGRPDLAAIGVTRGGAADTWSHAVANALVGNPPAAASLELTMLGPTLRAIRPVTIGLAGALAGVLVERGERVRPGSSVTLREGWTLALGTAEEGLRGSLAIPGGIDVPFVLGSRSTALGAAFGGLDGRPLRAGDRIRAAAVPDRLMPPPARWPGAPAPDAGSLRVIPGPHLALLDEGAFEALLRTPWTVSIESDRVGLRLDGEAIPRLPDRGAGELPSHGVLAGTIQLPPDGRPIVLLADHQPTGGYPVVAVVIAADLPLVAQLAPGAVVRLETVTPAEAREALRSAEASFAGSLAYLRDAAAWDDLWHGAGG